MALVAFGPNSGLPVIWVLRLFPWLSLDWICFRLLPYIKHWHFSLLGPGKMHLAGFPLGLGMGRYRVDAVT